MPMHAERRGIYWPGDEDEGQKMSPGNAFAPFRAVIRVAEDDIDSAAPTRASSSRSLHTHMSSFRGLESSRPDDQYGQDREISRMAQQRLKTDALVSRVESQTVLYQSVCELRGEMSQLHAENSGLTRRNSSLEDECAHLRAAEMHLRPAMAELHESRTAKEEMNRQEAHACALARQEIKTLESELATAKQSKSWEGSHWHHQYEVAQAEVSAAKRDVAAWQRSCNLQKKAEMELEIEVADVADRASASLAEERVNLEERMRRLEDDLRRRDRQVALLERGADSLRWEEEHLRHMSEVGERSESAELAELRSQTETLKASLRRSERTLRSEVKEATDLTELKMHTEVRSAQITHRAIYREYEEFSQAADHFLLEEQQLTRDNHHLRRVNVELQEKMHTARDSQDLTERVAKEAQHRLDVLELMQERERTSVKAEAQLRAAAMRDTMIQCDLQLPPPHVPLKAAEEMSDTYEEVACATATRVAKTMTSWYEEAVAADREARKRPGYLRSGSPPRPKPQPVEPPKSPMEQRRLARERRIADLEATTAGRRQAKGVHSKSFR